RRVTRRGLLACEVLEPDDEDAVRSRLARCDVFVALQPAELDPYLWQAATGSAVVAPNTAATAVLAASDGFIELAGTPTRDQLTRAMQRAVGAGCPAAGTTSDAGGAGTLRTLLQVA